MPFDFISVFLLCLSHSLIATTTYGWLLLAFRGLGAVSTDIDLLVQFAKCDTRWLVNICFVLYTNGICNAMDILNTDFVLIIHSIE